MPEFARSGRTTPSRRRHGRRGRTLEGGCYRTVNDVRRSDEDCVAGGAANGAYAWGVRVDAASGACEPLLAARVRHRGRTLVHHDDAARELSYDRSSAVGRLARGLDEAPQRGWLVVSMRDDWTSVCPRSSPPAPAVSPATIPSARRTGRWPARGFSSNVRAFPTSVRRRTAQWPSPPSSSRRTDTSSPSP